MSNLNCSSSMYIGETTGGVAKPVFFDTHTPMFNNRPATALVTGSSGGGKTFFALTVAAISALLGKTTIILDPKGDFISLYNLQDQLGKINLMNLGPDGVKDKKGILDPFYMADDPGEKLALVISVIDLFVGGLTDSQMTVLSPIVKDVIEMEYPSLRKVMEGLRGSIKSTANDLGTKLDVISRMPLARLCFDAGNKQRKSISTESGITVITLVGVDLPTDATEAKASNQGRLTSAILYLITDFITRTMNNDTSGNPKTFIIDEAWAILASEQGASTIKSVSLLGRSKNVALMLITQDTAHLEKVGIKNNISTRFAFRAGKDEGRSIITDMDLPQDEGFEDILVNLNNGECLMQDFRGRYSTVQITRWRSDWNTAFETNPYEKSKERRRQRKR